ncbi:MAG TPA: FAD/NAD(P)-binding protein [Frankiaceae bacterium]|nr:FAD/NAD(P)-binding protein [Frankiaceae bacterium]
MLLETDYLVVGAGASGLAFTDSLVDHSSHDVLLVDRRHGVGGHWLDTYPFVRLHQPSAHYGVASLTLGNDAIDRHGPNAGLYECATGAEVVGYFSRVLTDRLLPTGRVLFLGLHDYVPGPDGAHRLVSRLTGETVEVTVRRKVVDTVYGEVTVPATHTPSFAVAPGVAMVPVGGLAAVREPFDRYVVLGGGKTGIDAVLWLLDNGVPADRVTWVRPRDAWLLDRRSFQPLDLVWMSMEGFALDLEAAAGAESLPDLYRRLEERGRLLRVDPDVEPTLYRCATVTETELAQLRSVRDVVRLGRVVRIDPDEVVCAQGSVPGGPHLYVDCTASGIVRRPPVPVFAPDRITVQPVRQCAHTFNAALIGYVEATRAADVAEQNRLCPANPYPEVPRDWARMLVATMASYRRWLATPDLAQWVDQCRLNLFHGVSAHLDDPRLQQAAARSGAALVPALTRLKELLAETETGSEPAVSR